MRKQAGGSVTHAVIENGATLLFLADQACITPHVWLSRAASLERPDQMIFDLDPPAGKFALARKAAIAVNEVLDELGMQAYVKTTGGKGLHVHVPLDRRSTFDDVRAFARGIAALVAARHPREFTTEQRKQKRRGLLYLDVMRNAYGQTAVAPYAVRARKGAPVATPLGWDELARRGLAPGRFTLKTVPGRVARATDPWRGMRRQAFALGRRGVASRRCRSAKFRRMRGPSRCRPEIPLSWRVLSRICRSTRFEKSIPTRRSPCRGSC